MSTYQQQYEVAQNEDFQEMVLISILDSSIAVQAEDPADLDPPIGFEPGGAYRKQNWHLKRSGKAVAILSNPSHYVENYAFSVANEMGAYLDGTDLKFGSDQALTDNDVKYTTDALFDAWAGSHS